ncbi:unnamed protein product, partial [Tetraodon nigroviridis]
FLWQKNAEAVFRKATVLYEMGQVDKSLQVFLQCLVLDESFPCAKRHMEKILCDLLSPAGEKVKEGLRETAHSTSPHLRNKTFMADEHGLVQKQHGARTASAHNHPESQELGDREKGSLLKRKLSVSDTEPSVVDTGNSKYKKQGVAKSSIQHLGKEKTCKKVSKDLLDPNDFECALCMRLFYEPVSTPCGHTFCKNCLERCMDHTPHCPLCKESLKQYLACRKYMVTTLLDTLIKQNKRQEYAERTKTHADETRELSEFVDYGCMLIIRSVHFLPDGRSVVDTVGGKRFRVLTRGMKDGYSTANIEHLEDTRAEDSEEHKRLQELYDAVYDQARVWFQNLKVRFHNQILQHFGPMPEREADIQATPNGPACCWWLLAVLPIDPRYQLSVLSMTSLRERLVKIQQILAYLQ